VRPEILFPLFADVSSLKGVGTRMSAHFERLLGNKIIDVLWHLPSSLIDRRWRPEVDELIDGAIATIEIVVGKHNNPPNKRAPYKVHCYDDSGKITLVFFHAHEKYLKEQLVEGEKRIISGRVEKFGSTLQMTHPDYIIKPEEIDNLPLIEPLYPLTAGLSQKVLLKGIKQTIERIPNLPEWQEENWLAKNNWPSWNEALLACHNPASEADLAPTAKPRMRLAYDELLANQLALSLVRLNRKRKKGRAHVGNGNLRSKVLALLPYSLTNAQLEAIADIDADMHSDDAMLRLLQGDVGSGKTIVAFLASLSAIEAGTQAAFLAPTEILAKQHYETLTPLCEALGLNIAFLTGRHKGKKRDAILASLASGETNFLVGTHAVFQEGVDYKDLGFAVVDEQHRFGVYQRLSMASKGKIQPDMLVMTATPIPRTLSLTIYGDMDVTLLREKPAGRKPIKTSVVSLERIDAVVDGIKRTVERGERVYWVCPLVDTSEVLDLAAAEDRYEILRKIFGDKVGLVYGRMKASEKDAVMAKFQLGELQVLVATTVIEVGVDVPEATVMVIEHGERFGLAQIHQLRGRVGRGEVQSSCVLLREKTISEMARARLRILRDTQDGFIIAEEDLRLRGAGEVLGTRQSGLPKFRVADLAVHGDLLSTARDDAQLFLNKNKDMSSERAKALRILLYLFERDDAVKFLNSG
jgi:ATP-dependent DNA helicase RecG